MLKLKKNAVGIIATCLTVVLLLIMYVLLGGTPNPSPQPLGKLQAPNCSFSVKSFCTTEASMKQYVAANDFSDILENQVSTTMVCDGAPSLPQYCQPADSGAMIQLFQVKQQNGSAMMTRNQYITFFMTYSQDYGSLHFASTSVDGNDVLMSFKNKASTYTYDLLFAKNGSGWRISYPSLTVIQ